MRLVIALASALAVSGCTERVQVLGGLDGAVSPPDARVMLDAARPPGELDIAAGGAHTCAVVGGAMLCWGENAEHALGQPDTRARSSAVQVGNGTDWVDVAVGYGHSCGIRGLAVYCWGSGADGRLGIGSTAPEASPQRVSLVAPAAQLVASFGHVCALLEDGSIWCWGDGDEGQHGQGDPFPGVAADALRPVRVAPGTSFRGVGLGEAHTCAIDTSGALSCVGRNVNGLLGLPPGVPEQLRTLQPVGRGTDWMAVAGGSFSACGLRGTGTLWCWGLDGSSVDTGPVGLPGTGVVFEPQRIGGASDWRQVALDTFHACGLRGAGELWCWGRNDEGQLGTGDLVDRDEPTRIGSRDDWARIAVGRFHTCALAMDGTAWCTGENDTGQLGVGDFERRRELTQVVGPLVL